MGELVPYNPKDATSEDLQHRCQPFILEWVFGFNPRVSLLNITTRKDAKELVMASGNTIIFYKFENQAEIAYTLVGHKTSICMMASDKTGRFVASSDSSYCINVWDREANPGAAPVAIRTIYEPFKSDEINAVGLSHDGRYLIAACSGTRYLLQLWQWTIGNDTPDDTVELPSRLGKIKNIRFCPDLGRKNHFVVTLENGVIFGCFDSKNQKLHVEVPKKHGFQDYNDSVFVDDTPRAVSVTAAGMAIVWNDDKKVEALIKKQFLKYLHLKYASINVIKSCDQKLITGDDDGEIRFYDNHMRILYWFKQEDPEPIRTISFNVLPRKYVLDNGQVLEGEGDEEILCLDSLPRDVSLEGNPVIIRNFVMATKSGRIYEVDIVQNKIQELYYPSPSIITSCDVHPSEAQFCSCDGNGKITIYDLKEKQATMSLNVPIQRTRRGRITVLSYSPCGTFLIGGAENGFIWVINPATMIISGDCPLQFSNEKIRNLIFSPDSKFLLFTDDETSVGLLQRENENWKLIGKCISHKIVDLLFISGSRFLTIGDDRRKRYLQSCRDRQFRSPATRRRQLPRYRVSKTLCGDKLTFCENKDACIRGDTNQDWTANTLHLVAYNIEHGDSSRLDSLVIGERYKIEQSAQTMSLLLLPEDRLLVANDQFKFKIFDLRTLSIMHTFLAPFHDGQIRQLCLLPGDHFITFMTDRNIYVHQLPIDGNPFKYMGMFAHPKKLKSMRNMKDHFIFCYGEGDHGVSMWKINTIPLIENQKYCGSGLDPYCSLLPGGKSGCYVKEMLSLFFYNQISPKHNEEDTEISIRDAMDVRDVPNYMRSIGFHMTQFEESNLAKEIEQRGAFFLTFEEVVKLFLNHRTLVNPSCEDIRAALTYITKRVFDPVDLKSFNELLATLGEKIDFKTLDFYSKVLFSEYAPTDNETTDENGVKSFLVPLDEFTEKLC